MSDHTEPLSDGAEVEQGRGIDAPMPRENEIERRRRNTFIFAALVAVTVVVVVIVSSLSSGDGLPHTQATKAVPPCPNGWLRGLADFKAVETASRNANGDVGYSDIYDQLSRVYAEWFTSPAGGGYPPEHAGTPLDADLRQLMRVVQQASVYGDNGDGATTDQAFAQVDADINAQGDCA